MEVTVRIKESEPPEARATFVELRDDEGPDGDTETERFIVPAKLLWLVRVIVEELDAPDWIVSDA